MCKLTGNGGRGSCGLDLIEQGEQLLISGGLARSGKDSIDLTDGVIGCPLLQLVGTRNGRCPCRTGQGEGQSDEGFWE